MKKFNKMKNILNLTLVVFTFFTAFSQNGEEAKKILDQVSDKMSSYKNIYIEFDYILENKTEDVQQDMNGDVILQGDKYIVNFFGSTQMFDGIKTYTIIPENEEVNISIADIDDNNTITPSKLFSFYKIGYTYNMDELKNIKGKKIQFVKLVPIDSNSEVASVLVGINNKTNHIYIIKEIGKNGTDTTLTVKKIKTNQNLKDNLFLFDQNKYEDLGYIIND